MDPETLLKTFLLSRSLMQLATVHDNQPWLCNVYFVSDEAHNLYWTSARLRRHSRELIENKNVAATIVYNEIAKQAVQMAGTASEVPFDDLDRVHKLYSDKFGDKPSRLQEILDNKPEGRAYYMLKPSHIFLWDEVNFSDSPKQEIKF